MPGGKCSESSALRLFRDRSHLGALRPAGIYWFGSFSVRCAAWDVFAAKPGLLARLLLVERRDELLNQLNHLVRVRLFLYSSREFAQVFRVRCRFFRFH